jgi:two-component system, LytTR family, response regulator
MIRTVIIDDEPNNVEALSALLKKYCAGVFLTGTADSSETGIALITEVKPELVLLDIEMPFGNAFDMLDKLVPVDFEIIFITAFDNYAINAFHYSALDYLLKPVNIKALQAAVQKAITRISEKNINQRINNLLSNLKTGDIVQQSIALPSQTGLTFVRLDDITWLEANSSYTNIYLQNKQKIVVSKTMGDFETMLPAASFSRVHHSYIVSHRFIRKYFSGRGGYLEMEDGTVIEVSIRKKDMFLSKFLHG